MTNTLPFRKPYDWQSLVDEFQHTSDRAVVILGTSYLKNHLGRLIKCFLIQDQDAVEQLIGPEAPIETLGARIRMAYAMGLISPNEYHDLILILDIRNAFLDGLDSTKLSDEGIYRKCISLRIPREVLLADEITTPRRLFEFATALISGQLIVRAGQAERERRIPPRNFILIDVDR
jgi:DNA-binding MltR family transcriptional regulator